jgi:hypothetical protein
MFRYLCVVVEVAPTANIITLNDGTSRFTVKTEAETGIGDLWLCQGYLAPGCPGAVPYLLRRINPLEEM